MEGKDQGFTQNQRDSIMHSILQLGTGHHIFTGKPSHKKVDGHQIFTGRPSHKKVGGHHIFTGRPSHKKVDGHHIFTGRPSHKNVGGHHIFTGRPSTGDHHRRVDITLSLRMIESER